MATLTTKRISLLKRYTLQSRELEDNEKITFAEGAKLNCKILGIELNHYKIQLEKPILGFYNWYAYIPHWQIEGDLSPSTVDWHDPNSKVSEFFTVAEVTQNDDRRIPRDVSTQESILSLAKELDKIRMAWGSPIGITSWYRPADVNAEVGGVSNSQHILGSAVDIYPMQGDGIKFENWLDVKWGDRALGYGQAAGRGFTHIDLREGFRRWDY